MSTPIPALSIRQPWAWLIVNGHKDIENRDWPTNFRGRLLIHASKTITKRGYAELQEQFPMVPAFDHAQFGGFVGWSNVVDCVQEHPSTWKEPNRWGFVLRNSSPLPKMIPAPGRLGFFNVAESTILRAAA